MSQGDQSRIAISDAIDEITQLRAELTAERELADRMAETVRSADYVIKSARPDSGWLVAYKDDIVAAYNRRNK